VKRSAGLKRSSLEQNRAWQQRSKPLKRGTGPKAKPKRLSAAERAAHRHFQSAVLAYPCYLLGRREGHVCEGRKDPHHLLPARAIRQHFMGRDEAELLAVLYAPAIGCPLCRRAHDLVEAGIERIWWEELTPECIELATSVGMEGRLRLACPERPRSERRRMLGRGCPECAGTVVGEVCGDCGAVFACG